MMSIEEEEDASLKELVTKTLQSNGVLGKIQAQLRASVFLALEEEFRDKAIPLVSPPTRKVLGTREGAVAASLVQDFLQCLGLDFSLAVFVPESGHPSLWSSPGHEELSSSLGLASCATSKERGGACGDGGEKGQKTPLLIELLRERATPPPSARELNGDASSVSDNGSSSSTEQQEQQQEKDTATHPTNPPPKDPENHIGAKGSAKEGQARAGNCQASSSLPPLVLENGRKGDEATVRSGKLAGINTTVDASPSRLQGLTQLDENKQDSDTSLNGEDKQYEDDFSSMSEKDGHDDDDDEEEEEEVEEDIEEDLGDVSVDDLLNSSASGVSDITKDQSLSQASGAPAYQEKL